MKFYTDLKSIGFFYDFTIGKYLTDDTPYEKFKESHKIKFLGIITTDKKRLSQKELKAYHKKLLKSQTENYLEYYFENF